MKDVRSSDGIRTSARLLRDSRAIPWFSSRKSISAYRLQAVHRRAYLLIWRQGYWIWPVIAVAEPAFQSCEDTHLCPGVIQDYVLYKDTLGMLQIVQSTDCGGCVGWPERSAWLLNPLDASRGIFVRIFIVQCLRNWKQAGR